MHLRFITLILILGFICFSSSAHSAETDGESDRQDVDTQEIPPVSASDLPPANDDLAPDQPVAIPTAGETGPASPAAGGTGSSDEGLVKEAKGPSPSKGRYSRPLLFAPEDNNIQFTSPQIKWDMARGSKINLGGLIFSSDMIKMTLDQVARDQVPRRYRSGDREETFVSNLSFSWPEALTRVGMVGLEDRSGKALWNGQINGEAAADWREQLQEDAASDKFFKAHMGSQFGLLDVDMGANGFVHEGNEFRFCLSRRTDDKEKIRICSNFYKVRRIGEKVTISPVNENLNALVEIGGEAIGPRGIVNFPEGKQIDLKVKFGNGATVALSSRPIVLKFLDVVESKDKKQIILTGQGATPIGKVKILEVPPNHFWSATGVKKEIIWQTSTPIDTPVVRVFGAWNIPFTYLIRFDRMPNERDRVFISTRTGSGTYVRGARIRTYVPSGAKLSSKETAVKKTGKNEYMWTFLSRQTGVNNKARLLVNQPGGQKPFVAQYQLYRGYPFEFSGRVTGIVSATLETVLIGEVATSYWAERAFGSDSYYFSEKRWGFAGRYFKALQSFAFSGDVPALSDFSVLNADLRYNLIPGIWNRDELFGLIIGAESINIAGYKADLGGVGFYWARTMPKIFDDIFNLLPFFRYPKYVDVDFTYYPYSFKSDIEAGTSFNLNFHGKVFWTPRVYGEAGFGTKQFDYIARTAEQQISVSAGYGTVGLGIIF